MYEKFTGKTAKCKKFYSSFLFDGGTVNRENKLAFDIGANKGNKIAALLKLGFTVIALEPEKNSLNTLKWRFAKNNRVTIIEKGVSDRTGSTKIFITEPRSGLNTMSSKWIDILNNPATNRWGKKVVYQDSYEVELTTLDDLIAKYGIPYFIKIDVEGFEYKVLKGLSHKPAFLSFETNLPEFLQETIDCIELLSALSEKAIFNYSFSEKLESGQWISTREILKKINDPAIRYMEIICKL
jgi:FkbM family methyltransferase